MNIPTDTVTRKEAEAFVNRTVESWAGHHETQIKLMDAKIQEVMLEDSGGTLVDKMERMAEGVYLLIQAINMNCIPLDKDDTLADFDAKIIYPE